MKLGLWSRVGAWTPISVGARAVRVLFIVALLSLALPMWMGKVSVANAATVTVTSCDQSSFTSAISQAGPAGTVLFGVDCTFTLSADVPISQSVTIDGNGHSVTIDGGGGRIFIVTTPLSANFTTIFTLNGVTLIHAAATGSTAATDRGAAIFVPDQSVTGQGQSADIVVNRVKFASNTASDYGAAIESDFGNVTVNNSTFTGNSAGIHGGAINNNEDPGPSNQSNFYSMTLSGDTFTGNQAPDGGAIALGSNSPMTVINSTFAGNTTVQPAPSIVPDGSAIYTYTSVKLLFTTIANNSGPGNALAFGDSGGAYTLKGDVLDNPTNANCSAGTVTDAGYNVEWQYGCNPGSGTVVLDPQVGSLADNGGPTATMALGTGSPAIGGMKNCTDLNNVPVTVDQRGVSRPTGTCDVGAYQTASAVATPAFSPSPDGRYTNKGTSNNPLIFTGTATPGTTVNVYESGNCAGPAIDSAIAASGNWATGGLNTVSVGAHTYTIQANDGQGNLSACSSPATLTVDRTAPTSTITFPTVYSDVNAATWNGGPGCNGGICGTVTDDSAGAAMVFVSVLAASGPNIGDYWNGTSFSQTNVTWNVAQVTGTGNNATFFLPMQNLPSNALQDGQYVVLSAAVDNAGNAEQQFLNTYATCNTGGGSLTVSGGGSLTVSGGGSLTTSGGGNLIYLGGTSSVNPCPGGGNGSLTTSGGGSLTTSGGGSLTTSGGGSLTVSGGGSLTTSGGGSLTTSGGGSLTTSAGGSLTTSGGGALTWTGGASLGSLTTSGGGSLTVSGGGSCADSVGAQSSGHGSLTTSAGGSLTVSGGGSLTTSGGGSLTTSGGGSPTASQTIFTGGGSGTCNILAFEIDTTAPAFGAGTPIIDNQTADYSVNINPGATLHLQFSESLDPTTVSSSTFIVSPAPSGTAPTIQCGPSGGDPLCLNLDIGGFQPATFYTLTVKGARDLAGNLLVGTFHFTTATSGPLTQTLQNGTKANADPDADGIPNVWDGTTFTVGSNTINTAAWGFTPTATPTDQKDLCVVENYMQGQAANGTTYDQHITQQANQDIVNAFAAHHIHLVIFESANSARSPGSFSDAGHVSYSAGLPAGYTGPDYGGQVPMIDPLGATNPQGFMWNRKADGTADSFDSIKHTNFVPTGLSQICHFALIAHQLGNTAASGSSRGIDGSDFVIALGSEPDGVGTEMQQAGTVMHELGHNLDLYHGGSVPYNTNPKPADLNYNYKPDYLSIMNYLYQFTGVLQNAPSPSGAVNPNRACPISSGASTVNAYCLLDYSEGALATVNESNLNETATNGLGTAAAGYAMKHKCLAPNSTTSYVSVVVMDATQPIDWNCTGSIESPTGSESYFVNADQSGHYTFNGYNDWANLNFTGGTIGLGVDGTSFPTQYEADNQQSTIDTEFDQSGVGANSVAVQNVENQAAIQKTNPVLAWVPGPYTFGQQLSGTQLDATSTVPGTFNYNPGAGTVLPPGKQTVVGTFTPADTVDFNTPQPLSTIINVQYVSSGTCDGAAGHQILQPVNADGSSVFKQGSTVPLKFRVCDANGNSVGPNTFATSVVSSFTLTKTVTGSGSVNEIPVSTTGDTAFRWDSTNMQWIYNLSTKNLSAGNTYTYTITLNDGSPITATFGLR